MKLVAIYAALAGLIALLTGPIPGTSPILTGLEVVMTYHIARRYQISLKIDEIGFVAGGIYAATEVVKLGLSTGLEFFPFIGWYILKPLVAVLFVLALGKVLHAYFSDQQRARQLDAE